LSKSRISVKFETHGPEMVSSLSAATFDFGKQDSVLVQAFHGDANERKAQADATIAHSEGHFTTLQDQKLKQLKCANTGLVLKETLSSACRQVRNPS
jgi:tyrosyl-tRNA synthetase